eukprot:195700-Pyramimonas_sp.AAC.1
MVRVFCHAYAKMCREGPQVAHDMKVYSVTCPWPQLRVQPFFCIFVDDGADNFTVQCDVSSIWALGARQNQILDARLKRVEM